MAENNNLPPPPPPFNRRNQDPPPQHLPLARRASRTMPSLRHMATVLPSNCLP
ncbi:unnamed protein product [Rhodiola kirilowii]